MQNKLLPCPICNKEVGISICGDEERRWWFVTRGKNKERNKNCECRLFMESKAFDIEDNGEEEKKDLIKQWNTRKPMERIVEQLESLYKYNAEQAEIYRNVEKEDAYTREMKDLYIERTNCYGVAIRTVKGGVDNG